MNSTAAAGPPLSTENGGSSADNESWFRFPELRDVLIAGGVAIAAWVASFVPNAPKSFLSFLYLIAMALGGRHVAREAWNALRLRHEVTINLLMLSAAIASCILGLWEEGAFLIVLYAGAEGVEELTFHRTRTAIRGLLDLAPKEATVLRNGRQERVPAATLRPGDRFLVRPGDGIATDGVVVDGTSSVDESAVTGESIPIYKQSGMKVFAGTRNGHGAIEVEATTAFADNTLSRIIDLVERAQDEKGRAQTWIERFGRIYSPSVLLIALAMVLLPALVGSAGTDWTHRAVVFLVAATPCALVMSIPVAMTAGIGRAGRNGVLIKGGAHLEHLASVRTIAFDKTGTLTVGKPSVTAIVSLGAPEKEILALAAGVEQRSEHPLARAIVTAAESRTVLPAEVTEFRAHLGAGASAVQGDRTIAVGSPEFFESFGARLDEARPLIESHQSAGRTVVLVGNNRQPIGLFAIEDTIRPGTKAALAQLARLGLHRVMLTGDNDRTARAVAHATGIFEVCSQLSPEGKVRTIEVLGRRFRSGVLMVGDGVNDAPALAAATCGMAMGVAGSDAAIEAADVALMSEDLSKVAEAITLARRVSQISKQNIVFSILVLLTMIPAAVSGAIGVTAAVIVHEASELLAVLNGLRVARGDRPETPTPLTKGDLV